MFHEERGSEQWSFPDTSICFKDETFGVMLWFREHLRCEGSMLLLCSYKQDAGIQISCRFSSSGSILPQTEFLNYFLWDFVWQLLQRLSVTSVLSTHYKLRKSNPAEVLQKSQRNPSNTYSDISVWTKAGLSDRLRTNHSVCLQWEKLSCRSLMIQFNSSWRYFEVH